LVKVAALEELEEHPLEILLGAAAVLPDITETVAMVELPVTARPAVVVVVAAAAPEVGTAPQVLRRLAAVWEY
jgi:hypothetical protein